MANKMTICKACGAQIATSAKSCPNCGAKNKKPIYKRAWFIILIILLVLGIGGMAMGGSDDEPTSTDEPLTSEEASSDSGNETKATAKATEKAIEYESISADQLSEDLEANAAAAKDKYDGNDYAISGKLDSIDSDGAYITIATTDEWDFTNIQCYIKTDEQLDIVKSMTSGDSITVKGKITDVGEFVGYSVNIDSIE